MKKKKKLFLFELIVLFVVIVVALVVYFYFSSPNTTNNDSSIEETTSIIYHSKETVEENALSLIDLYRENFIIFSENKSINKDIAENARIRANSTAEDYNKYIQSNSYLWEDNKLPDGIVVHLPTIEWLVKRKSPEHIIYSGFSF